MMASNIADSLWASLNSLSALARQVAIDIPFKIIYGAADAVAIPAGAATGAVVVARRNPAGAVASTLALIGTLTVVSWGVSTVRFFLPYVLPSRLRKFNHAMSRPWAVVTGASDGIGKGFALELAAGCYNLVLVARNKDKLAAVAKEITAQYPSTAIKILVTDAGNVDQARFLKELDTLVATLPGPLTILVNNVGVANTQMLPFVKEADKDTTNIIVVNDVFPPLITKRLLPVLEKNQPSLILNVGSFASEFAFSNLSTYAGSKAFNRVWSECLETELRLSGNKGVEVQALLVGPVTSQLNRTPEGFFCPSARKFARSALRVSTRRSVFAPYFPHALQFGIFASLPKFLVGWLSQRMLDEMDRQNRKPVYVEEA